MKSEAFHFVVISSRSFKFRPTSRSIVELVSSGLGEREDFKGNKMCCISISSDILKLACQLFSQRWLFWMKRWFCSELSCYVLFSLYWFRFHTYVILLENPLPFHLKFFMCQKIGGEGEGNKPCSNLVSNINRS